LTDINCNHSPQDRVANDRIENISAAQPACQQQYSQPAAQPAYVYPEEQPHHQSKCRKCVG